MSSAMKSRVAGSPARGHSRGRSRARNSSATKRTKSFEELWDYQQRVAKLRKQVQQQYPKKKIEDLVAWLETAQTLVENGKIARELKASDAASVDSDYWTLKRRLLFASRDEILASVNFPERVKVNSKILVEYLGEGSVLVVDDVDCVAAKNQHADWFARLQAATRHSTAMVVTLTSKLAEGAKTLLGNDASTAASLSQQWLATDQALMAEERLLNDKTALQMLDNCVKCAMESADDLRAYLSRSRDDWSEMETFQLLSEHLGIFPELAVDESFIMKLGGVTGLPLTDGAAAKEPGETSHLVEIHESNLRDWRRIFHMANMLHGNAVPNFVLLFGKAYAKYSYDGLVTLDDFCDQYEVTGHFLNTVLASVTSAATVFENHVGREHGNVATIFIDVVAGRVILGSPASLIGTVRMEGGRGRDQHALMRAVGQLALAHGLERTPGKPLFKPAVLCDFCNGRCIKSYVCPGLGHVFCEDCIERAMNAQTKESGNMPQPKCPMPGCTGVWSDVELLKMLPGPSAEQAHKRRRLHLEMELRLEIRSQIQEELAAASRAAVVADGELRPSLVADALNLLVDQCRGCGQAFDDFDGCFAIGCECGRSICGYCLASGTSAQIHVHIASNDCGVRSQMFPDAQEHTFQQGPDQKVEFGMARRLRIHAELTNLFETLGSRDRTLLARRILQDVTENGVDLALVVPGVIEELQERG